MIAIVFFDDITLANLAFDRVQTLDDVEGVVVGRDEDGHVRVERGVPPMDTAPKTGLIGALIGALGGPLGALLGATGASIVGQEADIAEYQRVVDGIAVLADRIRPGTSALMLTTDGEQLAKLAQAAGGPRAPSCRCRSRRSTPRSRTCASRSVRPPHSERSDGMPASPNCRTGATR